METIYSLHENCLTLFYLKHLYHQCLCYKHLILFIETGYGWKISMDLHCILMLICQAHSKSKPCTEIKQTGIYEIQDKIEKNIKWM